MSATLRRLAGLAVLSVVALLGAGCTTTAVLVHLHDKLTEGDPPPCWRLNSVERALQTRCGAYEPGRITAADVAAPGLPVCALTIAAREPQLWPALPDLIAQGASPERCQEAPLAALAQRQQGCADFAQAPPAVLGALRWLAEADSRAVQHDVVRLLSCPSARAAGLDVVLDGWATQGALQRGSLPFSPLSALHPSHLRSPLTRLLEAQGHRARDGVGSYAGQLPSGYELALQSGDFAALDWWLDRAPELVDRVPASRAQALSWLPLVRVMTPAFIADPALRERSVAYLLARGADPWARLPHDPSQNVLAFARTLHSPQLALLEAPRRARPVAVAARAD